MIRFRVFSLAAVFVYSISTLAGDTFAAYQYANVVDTTMAAPTGTFTGFGPPSISGARVAFSANYSGGGEGVFSSLGGSLTTIMKSGDIAPEGTFEGASTHTAISGSTVSFIGSYGGGSGVFRGSGGVLMTVVKTGDAPISNPLGFYFQSNPWFGADNAYYSGFDDLPNSHVTSNSIGVTIASVADGWMGNRQHRDWILRASGSFVSPGFIPNELYSLDNFLGVPRVQRHAAFSSGGTAVVEFAAGGSGIVNALGKLLVKSGDPVPAGLPGEVFTHFDRVEGSGITFFTGGNAEMEGFFVILPQQPTEYDPDPLPLMLTIARTGDPAPVGVFTNFKGFGFETFYGEYTGGSGVFVAQSQTLRIPVIQTSQALFGSTVVAIDFLDSRSLDGIAFGYTLADGRRGIAMATPLAVPEPAMGVLLATALAGLAMSHLRRRS